MQPYAMPSGKGYPNTSVSPSQIARALLITDAIFKAAENRGYEVNVSADSWGKETRITKEGEEVRTLGEMMQIVSEELSKTGFNGEHRAGARINRDELARAIEIGAKELVRIAEQSVEEVFENGLE